MAYDKALDFIKCVECSFGTTTIKGPRKRNPDKMPV